MSTARNRRRTRQRKAIPGKVMDKLGRNGQDMGGYTIPNDVAEEMLEFLKKGQAIIGKSFDWAMAFAREIKKCRVTPVSPPG